MAHQPTNIDHARSPIVVPYAILGVLSLLAMAGALLALSSH